MGTLRSSPTRKQSPSRLTPPTVTNPLSASRNPLGTFPQVGDLSVLNLQYARAVDGGEKDDGSAGQYAAVIVSISDTGGTSPSCLFGCTTTTDQATVSMGFCYAEDTCIADGEYSPFRPCFQCVVSYSQTELDGPRTDDYCYIDNVCVAKETARPEYHFYNQDSICESCRPELNPLGWSLAEGYVLDVDYAKKENGRHRRSDGGAGSQSDLNTFGHSFVVDPTESIASNGCYKPANLNLTVPAGGKQAAAAASTSTDPEWRARQAIAELDAGPLAEPDTWDAAWVWYNGDETDCSKKDNVCVGSAAQRAYEVALLFGTVYNAGVAVAKVKVNEALALGQTESRAEQIAGRLSAFKDDAENHILVTEMQCALAPRQCPTVCTATPSLPAPLSAPGPPLVPRRVARLLAAADALQVRHRRGLQPTPGRQPHCASGRQVHRRELPHGHQIGRQ